MLGLDCKHNKPQKDSCGTGKRRWPAPAVGIEGIHPEFKSMRQWCCLDLWNSILVIRHKQYPLGSQENGALISSMMGLSENMISGYHLPHWNCHWGILYSSITHIDQIPSSGRADLWSRWAERPDHLCVHSRVDRFGAGTTEITSVFCSICSMDNVHLWSSSCPTWSTKNGQFWVCLLIIQERHWFRVVPRKTAAWCLARLWKEKKSGPMWRPPQRLGQQWS